MAGDSDDSSSSRSKRPKTLAVTSPSMSSDCKAKIQCDPDQCEPQGNQQLETNSPSRGCSICFLEDGNSIRGEINCCDHYFCFFCIMEWAKIESRCPMCRHRFNTIRRPPKVGLFARERIVRVPVRDQVNFHFGNTTLPFDPYAHVVCNVCNGMADGNLLLLCDLCDSAAHTYCVGLGVTVPEGDWFCHDCTVSRAEQYAIREIISEDDNRNEVTLAVQNGFTVGTVTVAQASPYPIVERPPTNSYLPPAVLGRVNSSAVEVTGPVVRNIIPTKSSESGARTLDRCRNVHSHIQSLRENWNALRMGSLSFSSSSFKPGCSSQKPNMHESSVQAKSLSSASCQQSQSQDGCGSLDIDKAWKMLDIAKSKLRAHEKTGSVQPSKLHPSQASASKERSNVNSINLVKCQRFGSRDLERSGKEKYVKSYCVENRKYSNIQKKRHSRVPYKEEAGCSQNFLSSSSPGLFESLRRRNVGTSTGNNICHEKRSILLQENINEVLSYTMNEKNESTCSVRQGTSEFLDANLDPNTSSADEIDTSKFNDFVENKERRDDGSKREIQSLVKLNLKLLSRDKQLGTCAFKEIARLATHTILAACGLEHRKSEVYSFPSVVCTHNEHSKQSPKSNLMPKSCRQCFYVFVKDVVNSIMFDKVGSANVIV
ncbi:hypothetical protein FNV43_RR20761 [Rhamnella rubrinervis]|uniref:PHD and RING finger domain-containing protein 1 n=1 Tax=Rhamnella rubrinervis TaxID=2594499 RepID=A0A8K0DVF0_9ROSA|nr:hypothetical protein FNV43_RR20761 [Rhamnella rubrinervis]